MRDPLHAEPVDPIDYPESDGEPMAESDLHRDEMVALIEGLKGRYEDRSDVYVAGNLFFYYEKGKPSSVFAPDTMVIFGVRKKQRRTYKLWEEGRVPSFVLEVSSHSTSTEDEGNKMALCRRLGVQEYFLFDPEGDYLEPRLQGYRLVRGQYRPIGVDARGSLASETLGLRFHIEGQSLRAVDASTGEPLLRPEELRHARERAERDRKKAERDREKAERDREKAQRDRDEAIARAEAAEIALAALRREHEDGDG
jgi:Uma2 family endonuclease